MGEVENVAAGAGCARGVSATVPAWAAAQASICASHLLYPQPGILRDDLPEERRLGIEAGLAWGAVADATVVYTDRGISPGMQDGIDYAALVGRPIEYRSLGHG